MSPRELPEYLRPVPEPLEGSPSAAEATPPEDAAADSTSPEEPATQQALPEQPTRHEPPLEEPAAEARPPEDSAVDPASPAPALESQGLIPPTQRGHSGAFVTDAIVDLGYASRDQVEEAVAHSRTAGRAPESILIEQGAIDTVQLARATAERYGLDFVDLAIFTVDMAAANLISVKSARRHQAIPIAFIDEGTLLLAMADPANVLAVDDVQMATGLNCRVAVAPIQDIDALVGKLSTLQSTVTEAIEADELDEGPDEITDLRASAEDAPVIQLVNSILGQAVTEGASDIHFEPSGGEMRIRFRVDGVLQEMARVPRRMVAGVVSRVKIMSDLDIAEKRIPQDGRVAVTIEDRRIDLRVTTLPTQRGEGASIRILDENAALRTLDQLGMEGEERRRFENAFRQPYGAILVTGPTGAGKSTTLYAALQELNDVNKNIVTIEDPVEYQLDGVNQIGVHRKAGLTFATGLRSVLRADPDVIMVGEVRDAETGRIAIEAALTGHMVLTTLHTNDAPGAITRLQEMGIESFLTSSAVDCVVAQRLARVLCSHCKRRAVIPQAALEEAGFRMGTDLEAYESVGCGRCHGIGYRGRLGIYSVMVLSERIKEMVVTMAPEAEIAKTALEEGMSTLRDAGLAKVRSGVTSIEEVARVAS
jgi:type IV pilus assembly protein PilB